MLYTALHIGDQLISLGGKIINNAADAQKLIRAWPSLYVSYRLLCQIIIFYFFILFFVFKRILILYLKFFLLLD